MALGRASVQTVSGLEAILCNPSKIKRDKEKSMKVGILGSGDVAKAHSLSVSKSIVTK